MATNTADRLLQLKEEIEQAKVDAARIEGSLQQYQQQLKEQFKCNTLDSARVKLESMRTQKEALTQQIETLAEKLEANYEW